MVSGLRVMDALMRGRSLAGMATWHCLRPSDSLSRGCQVGEVEAESLATGTLLLCACPSANRAMATSLLFGTEYRIAAL